MYFLFFFFVSLSASRTPSAEATLLWLVVLARLSLLQELRWLLLLDVLILSAPTPKSRKRSKSWNSDILTSDTLAQRMISQPSFFRTSLVFGRQSLPSLGEQLGRAS
ncbi:hypothetical protein QHH03_29625, partial [Aphanizomenon sp. 202]|nr:hypothetical protein [Aphanizomenon sp. 202]